MVTRVGEREAGVQDVVDQQNIPASEISPALAKAVQPPGGAGALITGDRPELHLSGGFQMAQKIDDKKDATLE